jgi:hypothetical protein
MRPAFFQAGNQALLAQMQQVRRDWQSAGGVAASGQAQPSAPAAEVAARQPFRTTTMPEAAGQVQNRGVLFTGAVQMTSPSAPLARTSQRLPPAVRPVSFKRCSSCS